MTSQATYTDQEWGLLIGLPQAVLIATSSMESDGANRTLSEISAGVSAIAAGRTVGSPLVRDVSTELVALLGDPQESDDVDRAPVEMPDRADADEVVARARVVADLLADKSGPGDAAAYKHWLVTIADQVANAAKSGSFLGIGGEWVSDSERHFLDQLRAVLDD
jgi:hypothetical protein